MPWDKADVVSGVLELLLGLALVFLCRNPSVARSYGSRTRVIRASYFVAGVALILSGGLTTYRGINGHRLPSDLYWIRLMLSLMFSAGILVASYCVVKARTSREESSNQG